jgi:hypothetical protein
MNKLENQIKEMYHKAFYDIIDETIASNSPNYEWIVNLYIEIKQRLIRYILKIHLNLVSVICLTKLSKHEYKIYISFIF